MEHTREFTCEGCAQDIVNICGYPRLPGLPDLCGGCTNVGPRTYAAAMCNASWMTEVEAIRMERQAEAFAGRWGEAMADRGIPDDTLREAMNDTLRETAHREMQEWMRE